MAWIILYIPFCIWMGTGIISRLNIYSIGAIFITVAIFVLIEFRQVSRDKNRSKTPLWIMCMTIATIFLGVLWK